MQLKSNKKYTAAFVVFLIVFGLAALSFKILGTYLDENINTIIHRLFILFSAILLINRFNKRNIQENNLNNLSSFDFLLIAFVAILFLLNNIFSKKLGVNFDYNSIWIFSLVKLTISSIAEEFFYRGFIQTYINEGQDDAKFKISKGNLFATVLMTITHFGFFLIMTPSFAIISLILVVIFSLTAGYLKEKTNGLVIPITFHLTINGLHLIIQTIN